jgi:predicted TPR repeat methyltransferase
MLGRNVLCSCGSGKKYKHCCLHGGTSTPANPAEPAAHFDRGSTLLNLNRLEEAIASFRRALSINPQLAPAHNNLGVALKHLGKLDEAAESYRTALRLAAGYAPAHHNLGEALYRRGQVAEAKACFENALAIDAGLFQSHMNLGNILADSGDLDGAIRHYRKAIEAKWNLPGAYAGLGSALSLAGKIEEALPCFEKATAISPTSAEAHFNLAKAYLQGGNAQRAIQSVREAINLRPAFPAAHLLLAAALWCQGHFAEAVAACRTASPINQSMLQIYYTLATHLLTCGVPEKALECFQRVLEIEPNQPTALHFVASLQGRNPDHSAPAYVEQVFDDSAGRFNEQLIGTLRYNVPSELSRLVLQFAGRPAPWDVLDLGCGTGLFGAAIAAHRRRLVGIDLSTKMLEEARALNLYDRLERADLLRSLDLEAAAGYDLIAAADVFIYVGKLDQVVARVRTLLRVGGLFAFSAESVAEEPISPVEGGSGGYRLSATGRYVHAPAYLDQLARENNFTVRCMRKSSLRLENSRAVPGWLAIWEA